MVFVSEALDPRHHGGSAQTIAFRAGWVVCFESDVASARHHSGELVDKQRTFDVKSTGKSLAVSAPPSSVVDEVSRLSSTRGRVGVGCGQEALEAAHDAIRTILSGRHTEVIRPADQASVISTYCRRARPILRETQRTPSDVLTVVLRRKIGVCVCYSGPEDDQATVPKNRPTCG